MQDGQGQDEPDGADTDGQARGEAEQQGQERVPPGVPPVVPWSATRDQWVAEQAVEQERWRREREAERQERRAELAAEQSEAAAVQRAQAWSHEVRVPFWDFPGEEPPAAADHEDDDDDDEPLREPPPGWRPVPGSSPEEARSRAAVLPGQVWGRDRWRRPARGSAYARPLLALGATGTGKSRSAAAHVRAHEGPVLVVSTKSDLVDWTHAARSARGPVHVLDPAGVTGGRYPAAGFDLLRHARDLDAAGALVHALAAWRSGGSDDKDFWMALGASVNQAVAYGCARTGQTVADWHRLVLQDDHYAVHSLLARAGSDLARTLWQAYVEREERNRSSVILTARQQVRVLDSPAVQQMLSRDDVDPTRLLPDGPEAGEPPTTLYLTVPAGRVEVFGSLVPLVVDLVMNAALEREAVHGPAVPPLLVVLDEVAALGMARLPRWVDVCRSAGVQLLVMAQSLSTLATAFGGAACEQVLGSSDLLVLGGGHDPRTAGLLAAVAGDRVLRRQAPGTDPRRGFALLRALPRQGLGTALLLTDTDEPRLVRVPLP